jgi:hypothetical protein
MPPFAVLLGIVSLAPVFVSVQGIALFEKMGLVICRRAKSNFIHLFFAPDVDINSGTAIWII